MTIIELENEKLIRFKEQMLIELKHNSHKESILNWHDFDNIITELEYHKAKMFIAIRMKNQSAIKEYIADTANILFALGNHFNLYEQESIDDGMVHEIDRSLEIIKRVELAHCSKNQIL